EIHRGGGGRCFFFPGRGRDTSYDRDWSADVCSSDLHRVTVKAALARLRGWARAALTVTRCSQVGKADSPRNVSSLRTTWSSTSRSEERRVGTEGRRQCAASRESQRWRRGSCQHAVSG